MIIWSIFCHFIQVLVRELSKNLKITRLWPPLKIILFPVHCLGELIGAYRDYFIYSLFFQLIIF